MLPQTNYVQSTIGLGFCTLFSLNQQIKLGTYSYPSILPSPYLDNGPVVGLVEQLDDGGDAIVFPHSILCQLSLLVTRSQVTQSTNCRFGHILLLTGTQYGVDQCLNTIALGDQSFVVGIVACEIRQDASGTSEHVEII